MTAIQTLTDFLRATDASFRFFDLGRRLSKLPQDSFLKFERNEIAYPLPHLRQAWIAVLLWNPKQSGQHLIWFLKFPLDEQGKLVLAARDDFLQRLARSVSGNLLEQAAEEDPLKDNPFAFKPADDKMAAFHARATAILKQPPSGYYEPARQYLAGVTPRDQWQALGLQGLADLCARLDERDNDRLLASALNDLPDAPLQALCTQLEHVDPGHRVTQALTERLRQQLNQVGEGNDVVVSTLVRALSQSQSDGLRIGALEQVLSTPAGGSVEVLAAIGSRCWGDLMQPALRQRFLEQLAASEAGQDGFNRMLIDLIFIPGMRPCIMDSLRNPERSEALSAAIGGFFSAASQAAQS
ncbi:DUF3549 family protein [Motiliproteus sediminis]|uniref:DUF3549 family protein n=1 Tax=Motiliproteus sediminis TaxID=1468178 RepID=UPI001AEFAE30|nr:DUF3549 family protein [Motiliproteus sediminis]